MACVTCQGNSEHTSKCVIKALDIIKQHFLIMQNSCNESANMVSQLRQHNEKLLNAIELLQQRPEQRSKTKSSPKRRRISPKKPQPEMRRRSSLQTTDNISPLMRESQDSLNMNIALQPDNDEEETITETEPAISPYKPWNTRRKLNIRNCENEQPKNTTTIDTNTAWLSKAPIDKLPMGKTKMSLTLRSNSPRLKQTRLHFDAGKNSNAGSEKDVIESSPNLYTSLKHAKQSRSLLQRTDNNSVLDANTTENYASTRISNNQPVFDMDDDESFFDLCPDPSMPQPSSHFALPSLSGASNTSSVVLLTPGTQDIVFVDDSIDEPRNLNTMDFMKEVLKENDEASLTKLQEFEAKLIKERQMAASKGKTIITSAAAPTNVKQEPLTEPPSAFGNESTKLPEDFDMEDDEQEEEEEEEQIIPRPIVVKKEPAMSIKERYNIDCAECEKYIKIMGTSLSDEKIQRYLDNCRHRNDRELDNNTPDGFWNPHMVSFADDDPRNEVLVDRRFVDQKKK